jgi:hypothetical protein
MVSNMSTSSSFLLADVDQELANCRYVERLEMGGLDIHIINLIVMGEAWVTSQDIATLVSDWQRKGYSCSHAGQEEGGAGHHDGQQLHTPRPGSEVGGGGGEGCVQGGGPVDALQVGECPWDPEPVHGDHGQAEDAAVTSAV